MAINKTKRHMLPKVVKVPRKEYFWGTSARAGKHSRESSVALLHVLRDYLHAGDKEREITRILNSGFVLIDGKKIKDRRTAVGFMDLITLVPTNESFRVIYDNKGRLVLKKENEKYLAIKLMRVSNKKTIDGGKVQIVFHDGQNMISDLDVRTGDVITVSLPDRKPGEVYKLQPGSRAFITGGSHVGETGTVKKIEVKKSSSANQVEFEEGFETISDYVFIIGTARSSYDLTGEVIS
ncbi:MAG: 30S ribosomal protein S4e [Candidatus Thermoplasmatota archaeon]|nr:30S ribosomal protein S4e [Candidatus Thermoplasmatota archaeon]